MKYFIKIEKLCQYQNENRHLLIRGLEKQKTTVTFLKYSFRRYNSYSIQLTDLKYMIQWLVTYLLFSTTWNCRKGFLVDK